jgi:hypothetical protein
MDLPPRLVAGAAGAFLRCFRPRAWLDRCPPAVASRKNVRANLPLNKVVYKRSSEWPGRGVLEGLTMTDTALHPACDRPETGHLAIPAEMAAALPPSVREQLASLPEAHQAAFAKAFERRSANLVVAYLSSLIYGHYALLGRWAMSGWMWLSLFVASTLGVIWWLIDLVRMPRMVREHNQQVALDILRQLAPVSSGPTPLAGA